MTLRRQLALRYTLIVVACLLLLAGLAHHEFVIEPHLRQQLGIPELPENEWGEFAEVFFYGMIPVVLAGGWWIMRKTFTPLDKLAEGIERATPGNFHEPLPRTSKSDEVDRLILAFNNMTARLDESFRQVRDFTLNASHELKTPLTVMRAELEMLLKDGAALSPEKTDWIGRQLEEIQRLTKIVDALTLLAKADSGQIQIEFEPVHLGALVRENLEDALVLAEPHNVQVALLACDELTVIGDRHRLRQLLLNLVDNAIKYNRPGGAVFISLRKADNTAELEIINTGKGVSPKMQSRVFERFARGENAQRSGVEGSGLGLSIVQWIVQAHCGTIQFTSEPDKQTSVVVRLPII